MHSGNVLAFIGDGVLTLQVREYLVASGITKTKSLQEKSTLFVSANAQAAFVTWLIEEELVTQEELEIYKRGRNAKSQSVAKNAEVITYRVATGFEALWGHLYLTKQTERLEALWALYKEKVTL